MLTISEFFYIQAFNIDHGDTYQQHKKVALSSVSLKSKSPSIKAQSINHAVTISKVFHTILKKSGCVVQKFYSVDNTCSLINQVFKSLRGKTSRPGGHVSHHVLCAINEILIAILKEIKFPIKV
jgi:hypothetical protein